MGSGEVDDGRADARPATTLASLPVGQSATIVGLADGAPDAVNRRLSDLGFLAGTPVVAVRRAPLGEPTIYELRGYQMSLRRREAAHVLVYRGGDAS